MNRQLTVTSAAEYNRVLYGQMSPAMAVAYLQDNQLPVRTFSDVLHQMYTGDDLQTRLTDFFCRICLMSIPSQRQEKLKTGSVIKTCQLIGKISFELDMHWDLVKHNWIIC